MLRDRIESPFTPRLRAFAQVGCGLDIEKGDAKHLCMRKEIFICLALVCVVFACLYLVNGERRDQLVYNGWIDGNLSDQIREFPATNLKTIVIDSGGGDVDSAIEAAELMRDHKIKLVVDGYCLSACASILLASGSSNSIKEGSIVGFHRPAGLIVFVNEFLERERGLSLRTTEAFQRSERILNLYRSSGIRPDIFVAIALRQRLRCLELPEADADKSIDGLRMVLGSDIYIPNAQLFSQFGWRFEHASFPQERQFEAVETQLFTDTDATSLLIEEPDFEFPPEFLEGDLRFTEFEDCS